MSIRQYMDDYYTPPGGVKDHGRHRIYLCPFPDCPDTSGHFFVKFDGKGAVGHCRRCWRPDKETDPGMDLFAILGRVLGMPRKGVFAKLGQDYFDPEASMEELHAFMDLVNDGAASATLFPEARIRNSASYVPENVAVLPKKAVAPKGDAFEWWDSVFQDILDPPTMLGLRAQKYVFGRGLTRETIQKYHLKYAEKGEGEGARAKPVMRDGRKIYPLQTRMHGRIMFPVVMGGELVFYQGRAFLGRVVCYKCRGEGCEFCEQKGKIDHAPKYKNPTQGHDLPIGAGHCLFGLDQAMGKETVVVVEGPPDKISVGDHRRLQGLGSVGCVALMGHGLTWARVQLIISTGCKRVVLWYDQGLKTSEKLTMYSAIADHLPTLWTTSRVVGKKDAGEMSTKEVDVTLLAAKEMDFLERTGAVDLA